MIKTATHREMPPTNPDWWFVRAGQSSAVFVFACSCFCGIQWRVQRLLREKSTCVVALVSVH